MKRPAIPEPIKRDVRRACGFGCVLCGEPIYQYDHITPYAAVREHTVENLALLCGTHHDQKTRSLLREETVRDARENPVNVGRGWTAPFGLEPGRATQACSIRLGGNEFGAKFGGQNEAIVAIAIDHTPLVAFTLDEGGVYLTLYLVDDRNRLLASVEKNELLVATSVWDCSWSANRLQLRAGPGNFCLDTTFESAEAIVIRRGSFWLNRVRVDIDESGVSTDAPTLYVQASGNRTRNGLSILGRGPSPLPLPSQLIGARQPAIPGAFAEYDTPRLPIDR